MKNMSKVYFIKARKNNTPEKISADAATLFQIFLEQEQIRLAGKLPL